MFMQCARLAGNNGNNKRHKPSRRGSLGRFPGAVRVPRTNRQAAESRQQLLREKGRSNGPSLFRRVKDSGSADWRLDLVCCSTWEKSIEWASAFGCESIFESARLFLWFYWELLR